MKSNNSSPSMLLEDLDRENSMVSVASISSEVDGLARSGHSGSSHSYDRSLSVNSEMSRDNVSPAAVMRPQSPGSHDNSAQPTPSKKISPSKNQAAKLNSSTSDMALLKDHISKLRGVTKNIVKKGMSIGQAATVSFQEKIFYKICSNFRV